MLFLTGGGDKILSLLLVATLTLFIPLALAQPASAPRGQGNRRVEWRLIRIKNAATRISIIIGLEAARAEVPERAVGTGTSSLNVPSVLRRK